MSQRGQPGWSVLPGCLAHALRSLKIVVVVFFYEKAAEISAQATGISASGPVCLLM